MIVIEVVFGDIIRRCMVDVDDDANNVVDAAVVVDSIGDAENASIHLVYCLLTRMKTAMNVVVSNIIFLRAIRGLRDGGINNLTTDHRSGSSYYFGT